MRYDLTVPFARYVAQNKIKQIKVLRHRPSGMVDLGFISLRGSLCRACAGALKPQVYVCCRPVPLISAAVPHCTRVPARQPGHEQRPVSRVLSMCEYPPPPPPSPFPRYIHTQTR